MIDLRLQVDGIGLTVPSADKAQQAMHRCFGYEQLALARLEVVEAT